MSTTPMSKLAIFLGACCLLVCSGCSYGPDEDPEYQIQTENFKTDSVKFERTGGGQIAFTVVQGPAYLKVDVSRWRYKDTVIACRIVADALGSENAANLQGLFDGTMNISGVIPKETAPTGTWAIAYAKKDDHWLRIANPKALQAVQSIQVLLDTTVLKEF